VSIETFLSHRGPKLFQRWHNLQLSTLGYDWRNGFPLCATHHDAFDCHLFCIDPSDHTVQCKPGINAGDIGLRDLKLIPLKNAPHVDALRWRWNEAQRAWKIPDED
jgi:putative restriction endonuclease